MFSAVPSLVGVSLGLTLCALATFIGFDRDRAFYPTITIVIASYYALFAIMGGSIRALATESIAIAAFLFISIAGFRKNMWLIAGALCAHGVFDLFHGNLIANPGVPAWWPAFCLAFDVAAGAYLASLIARGRFVVAAGPALDPAGRTAGR
ncbi:MAG TPA: hypothetical protein VGK31_08300 [Thermoanaerobaculia bacterium]